MEKNGEETTFLCGGCNRKKKKYTTLPIQNQCFEVVTHKNLDPDSKKFLKSRILLQYNYIPSWWSNISDSTVGQKKRHFEFYSILNFECIRTV